MNLIHPTALASSRCRCNSSFVALIPKIKDPQDLGNFRPISLVGSLYKIIAKVLVNRLKAVMNDVISENQSAFVGGRNILDSPLIVSEMVTWANKSKSKMLILKVDFEKAYDTINWKFLFKVMEKMGFPERWIKWIKGCLVSGKGSVLVNGSPTSEFKFKRGLRQGDPLSPFLFIIAMEVINMLLKRAMDLGLFKGFKLPNDGPVISHLCYADDVLFIGEWSYQNVVVLNRLLRWLSLLSGLKINRRKCLLFGIGAEASEVNQFASIIRCGAGFLPFTYLGVPIGVNMKRAKFWEPVLDRFKSKLSKWKARYLSFAGRMTLIKSVLGSLPSYFLSIYAAPKCVLKKLEKIRREFLWGKSDKGHKLRWVRWNWLLNSKKAGGLGVGSIQHFNFAMLVKWWWRFKKNPNQLWAKVVAAIHGGNGSSSSSSLIPVKKSLPGIWKDVGSVERDFIKAGIIISDFLIQEGGVWKWRSDPAGSFSVKQVRLDLESAQAVDGSGNPSFQWNNWAIPKANFFLWRAMLGKIASKVGLVHRGVPLSDITCPRCGIADEDPDHILFNCLWSRSIWWNILVWIKIRFPLQVNNVKDLFSYIKENPGGRVWKKSVYTIAIATVWRIWIARNKKVFEDNFLPVSAVVDQIKEESFSWVCCRASIKKPKWGNWISFDLIDSM
ncbi:putative RNA-directed DNA polymerase [Helianthus annuus]|nr:putative RNA-directed DNA polymerase [Helianthus annuus]